MADQSLALYTGVWGPDGVLRLMWRLVPWGLPIENGPHGGAHSRVEVDWIRQRPFYWDGKAPAILDGGISDVRKGLSSMFRMSVWEVSFSLERMR